MAAKKTAKKKAPAKKAPAQKSDDEALVEVRPAKPGGIREDGVRYTPEDTFKISKSRFKDLGDLVEKV